jgi:hypothetical protein
MKRTLALLLLLVTAACDGGTRPQLVESLEIRQGALPLQEEAMRVGGTLKLSAQLRASDGSSLSGRPVSWRSTLPAVASVDSTGLVAGLSVGTALIIASADRAADTVRLSVVDLPSGELGCAPNAPVLGLAVGEVRTVTADEATLLCVAGGPGSEYALIPFNATSSFAQNLRIEVAASGIVAAAGPPSPALVPGGLAAPSFSRPAGTEPQPDHAFHRRVREWERTESPRLATLPGLAGPRLNLQGAGARSLAVGQTLELNVNSQKACEDPIWRTARVEALTQRAIVVADTSNPAGGFTREEFRHFGMTFDTLVWNVVTENFGLPTDVDGNDRVIVFFTRAVNEMTPPGQAGSYVGGFYYGRDLSPRTGTGACAGSNMAEIFYQLVPDPDGAAGNVRTKDFVAQRTVGVIAHEFQHLINHGRRRVMNRWPPEEIWLNEGLSHIAEELVFYRASRFGPRGNLDRAMALTEPVRTQYIGFQNANVGRLMEYLRAPHSASPAAPNDSLATRGATWSFLRYAADRKATPEAQQAFWYALVNSSSSGIGNLNRVIEASPLDWMHDWAVSTYADDAGFPADARHLQPSWNFRSIMPAYSNNNNRYPLRTIPLKDGVESQEQLTLAGGGTAYFRFGIAPGQRAAIRTTSNGITAPNRLRLSLVRTR